MLNKPVQIKVPRKKITAVQQRRQRRSWSSHHKRRRFHHRLDHHSHQTLQITTPKLNATSTISQHTTFEQLIAFLEEKKNKQSSITHTMD